MAFNQLRIFRNSTIYSIVKRKLELFNEKLEESEVKLEIDDCSSQGVLSCVKLSNSENCSAFKPIKMQATRNSLPLTDIQNAPEEKKIQKDSIILNCSDTNNVCNKSQISTTSHLSSIISVENFLKNKINTMDTCDYDSEEELSDINCYKCKISDQPIKNALEVLPQFNSTPPINAIRCSKTVSPRQFFSKVVSKENIYHQKLYTKHSKINRRINIRDNILKDRSILNFEKMLRICQESLDTLSSESSHIFRRTVKTTL